MISGGFINFQDKTLLMKNGHILTISRYLARFAKYGHLNDLSIKISLIQLFNLIEFSFYLFVCLLNQLELGINQLN